MWLKAKGRPRLDSGIRAVYTLFMPTPATPAAASANEKRFFDGFYRNTGKKTTMRTFRIFVADGVKLKEGYEGNASLVVRTMLEMFLNGELPSVEEKLREVTKL